MTPTMIRLHAEALLAELAERRWLAAMGEKEQQPQPVQEEPEQMEFEYDQAA